MKPRVSIVAVRKLNWLAPLLAVMLLPGVAGAADRVLIPEELDLPFYACGLGHNDGGEWVGAAFYRPLGKAPADLAANDFVSVDSDEYPLCVEGFAVMKEGEFFPMAAYLGNRPNEVVEIVFVPGEQFLAELERDGKVTFADLKEMDMVVGLADFYLEVQQPADRDVLGVGFHRGVIASGLLEDGSPFSVRSVYTSGAYNVDFKFGD